jgi:hypothetical protein
MPNEMRSRLPAILLVRASDALAVYGADAARRWGTYLWTVPLPLGRLDLLEKIRSHVILCAIFCFLVIGTIV